MKVWLTRKYAERLDGIDLRSYEVGDTLELSRIDARLMLAERWAKPERRKRDLPPENKRRRTD